MLTSAEIGKGFFFDSSTNTTYIRLRHLEKGGFIGRWFMDYSGREYVWVLTPKGFRLVREKLPVLKGNSYLEKKMNHDYHVTVVHVGDGLSHRRSQVDLIRKSVTRYRLTANFYEGNHKIFSVVWLRPPRCFAKAFGLRPKKLARRRQTFATLFSSRILGD